MIVGPMAGPAAPVFKKREAYVGSASTRGHRRAKRGPRRSMGMAIKNNGTHHKSIRSRTKGFELGLHLLDRAIRHSYLSRIVRVPFALSNRPTDSDNTQMRIRTAESPINSPPISHCRTPRERPHQKTCSGRPF